LVERLVHALDGEGSIVSYNMGFEAGCMEALAEAFPQFAKALRNAIARLVDPLPIFRAAVYDKAFEGSFSIKAVAPAILGSQSSYEGMIVADGGAAQRGFVELLSPDLPKDRRRELRQSMLEYCRKDTMEMVALVKWLIDASKS
jgi:hypothetical protein